MLLKGKLELKAFIYRTEYFYPTKDIPFINTV